MLRWLATRGILFLVGSIALMLLAKWGGWYPILGAIVGAIIYGAGNFCGVQQERERNIPPYRAPWDE